MFRQCFVHSIVDVQIVSIGPLLSGRTIGQTSLFCSYVCIADIGVVFENKKHNYDIKPQASEWSERFWTCNCYLKRFGVL